MKKRFKAILMVFALVLAGSLLTVCHHHRYDGHGDPEKVAKRLEKQLDMVLKQVDATPQQREEIHQIETKKVIIDPDHVFLPPSPLC